MISSSMLNFLSGISNISSEQSARLSQKTKNAFAVAQIVTGRSTPVFLFGGALRNLLLDQKTNRTDFDFIGNFQLDDIQARFPNLVAGRWDHVDTIRLNIGGKVYDFTSATDIQQRLSVGDITASNLCMSPNGEVYDFFGGMDSLAKKEIKILNPEQKITDDPTRILRVFRFATELGFTIEEATLEAAIKYAHLLQGVPDIDEDVGQILSLDPETRKRVLENLHHYGIDRYLSYRDDVLTDINLVTLEKEISHYPQVEQVAKLFDTDVFLVGGAVRDMIWNKKINDLDFKVRLPIEDIIRILESAGFTRAPDYRTTEGQYYVSSFAGVVGAVINGVDVHLSVINSNSVANMIEDGDINFSCCVYSARTKKIVNPESLTPIKDKELRFCNPQKALADPIIILNALKQISRLPDIKIPPETSDTIQAAMPGLIQFLKAHPEFQYKVSSLCGGLNSEEVYNYFGDQAKEVFQGLPSKKSRLETSSAYTSITYGELTKTEKEEIEELLKQGYKDHFDPTKVFAGNISSIVYEKKGGKIISCSLVDGERVYSVAATCGADWMNIVADLAKNNYNIWCTADSSNPKIQAFCSLAGLTIETDPVVLRKILENKSEKYTDIEIFEQDGLLVFKKRNQPDDYPQVMLRS